MHGMSFTDLRRAGPSAETFVAVFHSTGCKRWRAVYTEEGERPNGWSFLIMIAGRSQLWPRALRMVG